MDKFSELLNGIALAGIICLAFFVGAIYGSNFDGEEWETLAAGFFGLTGGAFALLAAKYKENRNEDKAAKRFYHRWDHIVERYKRSCELALLSKFMIHAEFAQTSRDQAVEGLEANTEKTKNLISRDLPVEILIAFDKLESIIEDTRLLSRPFPDLENGRGIEPREKTEERFERHIKEVLIDAIRKLSHLGKRLETERNE